MNSSQIFNFQSEILFIKHTSYKNFYGLNSEDKDIIKIENIQDKENCLLITVNNVFNNELKHC